MLIYYQVADLKDSMKIVHNAATNFSSYFKQFSAKIFYEIDSSHHNMKVRPHAKVLDRVPRIGWFLEFIIKFQENERCPVLCQIN